MPDRTTPDPHAGLAAARPARAAAIDVGSNALRFLAAELLPAGRYVALEQLRSPLRLGHDAFLEGRLTSDTIDAAVDALCAYRARLDALAIARYRAVATSAVRDSRNGDELIRRVREAASIELEPITGEEEIRLVHRAVRSRIDLGDREWLLTDLGGGSVEVSLVDRAATHWTVSHELGAVRLLEELTTPEAPPEEIRRRIDDHMAELRIPRSGRALGGFIATGGNIETLARLAWAPVDGRGVARLPLAVLDRLIDRLASMSYARRIEELRLREDRADVILPAALVYERLCRMAGMDTIHVPNVGVKEGVILELGDGIVTIR